MPNAPSPDIAFADGSLCPSLGLGTWRYGENASERPAEVAALRLAFDLGFRLVDTAEMYAEGGAESVLGLALQGALRAGTVRREQVFIVTKVYPHHASGAALRNACDASRRRLDVDCIDLYLLHWRGTVPLAETIAGFDALHRQGAIARWGVSNFDTADLIELAALPGGTACAANQVYLSLGERGAEFELLPWQQANQMPLMAYSPLDQGALAGHPILTRVAQRHAGATPTQIALAALTNLSGVVAIPKSRQPERLRENWGARHLRLTPEDIADIDRAFPRPKRKRALAMT